MGSTEHHNDQPDSEAVRTAYRVEQGKLNEIMVVFEAESAATNPRRDELVAQHKAARRRLSAARGQLTRAQHDGNADKIAAALTRLNTVSTEFDRVSEAVLAEMNGHIRARLDNHRALDEQMDRAWAAKTAVTDARTQHRPPRSAP